MKVQSLVLACVCSLLISSCASNSPKEWGQIDKTEIKPNNPEEQIKGRMEMILKDPMTAQYKFLPLQKKKCSIAEFGAKGKGDFLLWAMPFYANAKNSYGAYEGNKGYFAYFNDGKIIDLQKSDWLSYCGYTYEQVGIPKGDPRRLGANTQTASK